MQSPQRTVKRENPKQMSVPPRKLGDESILGHAEKDTNSTEDSTWIKEEPKKRLKKGARSDELIISKPSELTYAEILSRGQSRCVPD